MNKINLKDIELDIIQDKKKVVMCESCEKAMSSKLYIVKNGVYGIFHLCGVCGNEVQKIANTEFLLLNKI